MPHTLRAVAFLVAKVKRPILVPSDLTVVQRLAVLKLKDGWELRYYYAADKKSYIRLEDHRVGKTYGKVRMQKNTYDCLHALKLIKRTTAAVKPLGEHHTFYDIFSLSDRGAEVAVGVAHYKAERRRQRNGKTDSTR